MSNLNELTPIQALSPFKRFCCTIGNLPSSYVESMSYMELVYWLCDYLKNTVIPALNNNAYAVQELQNFVTNYFENLDVQDEIDNKLDEMVESGELEEIISYYLNSNAIFAFDNVDKMKQATNLIDGSYARTLGYYNANDGGEGIYKIVNDNTLIDDGGSVHVLENGLKAVLIIDNNGISPAQFGAHTNNTSSSITTAAFQSCIEYCENNNIDIIDNGKSIYSINNSLVVTKKLNIDLGNSIIRATTSNPVLIIQESLTDDNQYTGNSHHGIIKSIIIDCNYISVKGIDVVLAPRRILENIRVTNVPGNDVYGYAYYLESGSAGAQLKLVNCYADNKIINNKATVLYNAKSDIVVDGLDWVGFSRGIHHVGGNAYYNNCHGFITGDYNISYPNSFFTKIANSTGRIIFNNPYPDTQKYGFYIDGASPKLKINGLSNFHNINIAPKECIETYGPAYLLYFNGNYDRYTSILNSIFTSPTFAENDDTRSVIFTNKEDQGFFIDTTTTVPIGLDLFEEKNETAKSSVIQLSSSTGNRFYRNDRDDKGLSKNKLYKSGNSVITDIELIYNPSIQGKVARTINATSKFARTNNFNYSTNIEQIFIAPYGTDNGSEILNVGYVYVVVLPVEIDGQNVNQSRFAIVANADDYTNSKNICDASSNQDYVIQIKGSYIANITR